MDFTVTELDYRTIKPLLERNGFALVEAPNPHYSDEVWLARIWSESADEGGASGWQIGQLVREFRIGPGASYTLTLSTFHLDRRRLHGLLTDITNNFVAAAKKG